MNRSRFFVPLSILSAMACAQPLLAPPSELPDRNSWASVETVSMTEVEASGDAPEVPLDSASQFSERVNCNDIDFNNDNVFYDFDDIVAFLSVYSEGPCVPEGTTCDSIDFNNDDSFFDPCDIASFLLYLKGPCTLCGF